MPESMSFSLTQLNLQLLLPMCISLLGGIVLLLVGVFERSKSRDLYLTIALLFVVLNLGFLFFEGSPIKQVGFFNLLLVDWISLLAQGIILIALFIILLFFMEPHSLPETKYAEFYALLLFAMAGFGFMLSSNNLILILLGLECASLSLYALIALQNEKRSFEAAIKYFTMGALATAFYAFGAMLLYLGTGSVDIATISSFLHSTDYEPSFIVFAGFVFLLCSLGFKVSMVPFHTWGPDVYNGSNSLLAAFIAIAPKIATFGVALRLFSIFIETNSPFVYYTLYTLVILTMTLPNLTALVQKDVKRLLAYSSISHSGFILAAIFINTAQSYSAIFLYWFLFLFVNLGAFGVLWLLRDTKGYRNHPLSALDGLIYHNRFLAIMLSLFMFSLAGIPPFGIFWGKMYLLQSSLIADMIPLAIAMVLNSLLAAFYYLKVVIHVFKQGKKSALCDEMIKSTPQSPSKLALFICAIVSIGSILMVQNLLIAYKF